jgi:hypothetical protein
VQIRLPGFDIEMLAEVGRRVRDIYIEGASAPERLRQLVDDTYLLALAQAVTGNLGGKVGVAPRLFLKKLIADVLDRVDQFPEFDPRKHYGLTLSEAEMTPQERAAVGVTSVDDVDL